MTQTKGSPRNPGRFTHCLRTHGIPMSQMSFSDFEYAGKRKQTRRERFLAEMDQVVPWAGLVALIEPYYPKAGMCQRQLKSDPLPC